MPTCLSTWHDIPYENIYNSQNEKCVYGWHMLVQQQTLLIRTTYPYEILKFSFDWLVIQDTSVFIRRDVGIQVHRINKTVNIMYVHKTYK